MMNTAKCFPLKSTSLTPCLSEHICIRKYRNKSPWTMRFMRLTPMCGTLLSLFLSIQAQIEKDMFESLSEHLHMNHVIIVSERITPNFLKSINLDKKMFKIMNTHSEIETLADDSMLIDFDGLSIPSVVLNQSSQLGTRLPSVIMFSDEEKAFQFQSLLRTSISQEVYWFNVNTGLFYEAYSVGEAKVTQNLAMYNHSLHSFHNLMADQQSLVERRSNFHGAHLKVFVCTQTPYLGVTPGDVDSKAVLSDDSVYDEVKPDQMHGIFRDLQVLMESELNFTSTYIQCKDRGWGDLQADGSYDGMVGALQQNLADLIGTSLTVKSSRYGAVDFLYPIGIETFALILPGIEREEFDWTVFVEPFAPGIWLCLGAFALIGALVFRITWLSSDFRASKCIALPRDFWSILCCYLGKNVPEGASRSRMALFTVAACGVVVWSAYRASLTSVLAVRIARIPFDSLEGLLRSDYQLRELCNSNLTGDEHFENFRLMIMGGGSVEEVFRSSPPDSVISKLFRKNFATDKQACEFIFRDDVSTAIDKLFFETSSRLTLWMQLETMYSYKELQCMFSVPWKSSSPDFLSMATPKSSPYFPFLQNFILKHIEMGTVQKLNMLWKQQHPTESCLEQSGRALTPEKIVTVFAIWAAGAAMAVITLAAEGIRKRGDSKTEKSRWASKPWTSSYQEKVQKHLIDEKIKTLALKLAARSTGREQGESPSSDDLIDSLEDVVRTLKRYTTVEKRTPLAESP